MAVTGTQTVRDLVNAALEDLEVKSIHLSASAAEAEHARKALYRMMKHWQTDDYTPDMLVADQSVTATTSAEHTLNPVRPLKILNANVKQNGIETPMLQLTRDEYDELPDKDATGLPTQFYYDRQAEAARFYVWPLFSSVTTQTFEITYEREFEDVTDLSATIELPGEWWDVAVLCLADRLSHAYGKQDQLLTMRAEMALNRVRGAAASGDVVQFCQN